MALHELQQEMPAVGNGSGLDHSGNFHDAEIQLALRNRGIPLEAIRYATTPTGLHYVLVHYDIPAIDPCQWRLHVGGRVASRRSFTLDEIMARPAKTFAVTMECAGNGRALASPRRISQPWLNEAVGTANWTGTSLGGLLREVGLEPDAVEIVFTGLDRGVEGGEIQNYQRSLTVSEAMREEVLLAYAMNGEPLPLQHGYPLRLVVPGWYGMTSVKWLDRIEATADPFVGYQMARAYRYSRSADDPGEPVTLIRVRALMVPPGVPDFLTRTRVVSSGLVTLTGRAWAGRRGISRVEISDDGGTTWSDAVLDAWATPLAWRGWHFEWNARPGTRTLVVRATDTEGDVQPLETPWNLGGYGNNIVQRVRVIIL